MMTAVWPQRAEGCGPRMCEEYSDHSSVRRSRAHKSSRARAAVPVPHEGLHEGEGEGEGPMANGDGGQASTIEKKGGFRVG